MPMIAGRKIRKQPEAGRKVAQAEIALRESEEKYQTVMENLNDVIFTLYAQGYFPYVSPVVERLAGFKPEEMIGRTVVFQICSPGGCPCPVRAAQTSLGRKYKNHRTSDINQGWPDALYACVRPHAA